MKKWLATARSQFSKDYNSYWGHLSRTTNLFVILNISLFFLTELVTRQSYFFTYFSLVCMGIVILGLLLPFGLHDRFWYYLIFLACEFAGAYFLVASAWFWVVSNKV